MGNPWRSKVSTGGVVVLDFWATWCVPCRVEFPAIEKIRSEFGDAVRFYGISDESPATVKRFVEEHRYKMPLLLDGNRECTAVTAFIISRCCL
jgi:thiol-disulfide isomerase/thioredoxin